MSNKVTHRSSKPDMLKYAAEELGVKLDGSKDRIEIWNEIKQIDKNLAASNEATPTGEGNHPEDEGSSNSENPDGESGTTEKPTGKAKNTKKAETRATRVLINLHQPPGSDDPEFEPDTHVIVGVNGVNYQLEIGKDLPVPYAVYDVLRNAKQKKYYRRKNNQTGETETISKEVLRHPFTVVKYL